jgi:hypothetical protein
VSTEASPITARRHRLASLAPIPLSCLESLPTITS